LAAGAQPDAQRQAELRHLLEQDCGSCHGLTLKGGLGPALLPEQLAGKPRAFLMHTILDGRPGTAMPPWRPLLSEDEAAWLVDRLLNGEEAQ
jgi:cytochrome c55X